jgi:hypothetical protein
MKALVRMVIVATLLLPAAASADLPPMECTETQEHTGDTPHVQYHQGWQQCHGTQGDNGLCIMSNVGSISCWITPLPGGGVKESCGGSLICGPGGGDVRTCVGGITDVFLSVYQNTNNPDTLSCVASSGAVSHITCD